VGQQKSKIISGEPEKTEKLKEEDKKEEIKKPKEIKKPDKQKKTRSKKYQEIKDLIIKSKPKTIEEAIALLKNSVKTPYDCSFEIHIALNMKPKENVKLKINPDKNLVIHSKVGKFSDKDSDLIKNIQAIIQNVLSAKPSAKKNFLKSVAICTSQSPSVKIKVEE